MASPGASGALVGKEREMPTTARIIARSLHTAGCRFAFGIPGGEVLTLIDALEEAGIRFVLAKHENAAGFMAEGAWHATGAPGVMVATLGPGVANGATAIANAWQDRVPLIVLTGCVDPVDEATYTHQVFDHRAFLKPVTKASLVAVDGAVDVVIERALALATAVPQGPVHVDVSVALAAASQPDPKPRRPRPAAPAAPAPGPILEEARQAFDRAERPLIIAGLEAVAEGAAPAVADFARRHGVPVVTTYKAKGVLPEDEPLALGGAGLSPKADRIILPVIAQSDCVLLAGYDPIEMRVGWRDPFGPDQMVIAFGGALERHGMHEASMSFVGDIAAGLAALGHGLAPRPRWTDGRATEVRETLRAEFAPPETWGPGAVFDTARRVLPADAVITADSGAHRILLSQMWRCMTPRTFLQSSGLAAMGCAVPIAAGYRLARQDRVTAAFVGDAGLEMVLGELATVRDLSLPVVIVVLVDESLALIELKQRRSGLPNRGVDFSGTDFPAVAAAMGGHGVWIDDAETLATELRAAQERDRFTVLACRIGRRAYDGTF